MPDNPAEIAERARIVREVGIKAREAGRISPTMAELNAALGDEEGVSNQARVLAGKTPRRYGVRIRPGPGSAVRRGTYRASRRTQHGDHDTGNR